VVIVNVQVFLLLPPLEQAPDQIASRPLVTLSVMALPVVKDALRSRQLAKSTATGRQFERTASRRTRV
jgi:hypothetical protein